MNLLSIRFSTRTNGSVLKSDRSAAGSGRANPGGQGGGPQPGASVRTQNVDVQEARKQVKVWGKTGFGEQIRGSLSIAWSFYDILRNQIF